MMHVFEQELTETIKAWPPVSNVLSTLHSEKQYEKATNWLDQLIDEVSQNADPAIESLIIQSS